MLSREQRTAILELSKKGQGIRPIARALKLSRKTVREVINSQSSEPPWILRPQKAEPYREQILGLHEECKGNLVRVHEELLSQGAEFAYPTLTAFCRRQGIGQTPIVPAGRYHFDPAQEIQHDTSPHQTWIGGKKRKIQTAVGALAHSRMLFHQCYPRFRRFECQHFMTEALTYFDGVPETVMIDNTHVVVLQGTGRSMIPVPEMESFAERFGFRWQAHEVGDANRKAVAERSFRHFETNFLAGRTFTDWNHLNQQAREWCDRVNRSYKRHLRARPIELFAVEKTRLRPLPLWIPPPYRLHHRHVDVEGYVSLNTNRYSVPVAWIGRQVQVRETWETVEIEAGREPTVLHRRVIDPIAKRITLPEHRLARGQRRKPKGPPPEEKILAEKAPELAGYIADLKKKGRKQTLLALRQLLRMVREYPREPLLEAFEEASHYGLYELDRVERMVLRRIASDYFLLPKFNDNHGEGR
jgi:transposase